MVAKYSLAGIQWLGCPGLDTTDHDENIAKECACLGVLLSWLRYPTDPVFAIIDDAVCHPIVYQHNNRLYFN
jgi:hypothetical protein